MQSLLPVVVVAGLGHLGDRIVAFVVVQFDDIAVRVFIDFLVERFGA